MELKGKVALIINGDKGLGYEISARLAKSGVHLVINYSEDENRIAKYLKNIKPEGEQIIMTYYAPANNYLFVKEMVEDIKTRFNRIDILVFITKPKKNNSLKSIDIEDWNHNIEEDLTGFYHCTKEISKIMVSQKSGKIIPVFFGIGARGDGELLSWSACSGGIMGFIKCLAIEFLRYRINVNGVAYGLIDEVDSPFMVRKTLKHYLEILSVPRTGRAEDVAAVVNFLASNDADYITGQILHVNGGLLI
jgi:3-oxoacyl-[acyl-carrier protein] reductase